MNMRLGRILNTSTTEYPGLSSAVIYFGGCKYRCPYCFEPDILDPMACKEEDVIDVFNKVMENESLLDAVTYDGGEPTEQPDALYFLMKSFNKENFKNKLNTNGENAKIILKLANDKILDYLCLDIKAPLNIPQHYKRMTGQAPRDIYKGIHQLFEIIPALHTFMECRTTLVPGLLHEHDPVTIAKEIGKKPDLYTIQEFDSSREIVDPSIIGNKEYEEPDLFSIAKRCKPYVKKFAIRTKEGNLEEL